MILTVGAPLLLIAFFYLKVYEPGAKKIKNAQDELVLVKNQYQIVELQENLGGKNAPKPGEIARRLKETIENSKTELSSIEGVFPQKSRISGIFREITDMAAGCGVEIVSFNPGAPQARGMYEAVPIDMSLRAQYFSIVKFVENLKKFPLIFDSIRVEAGKTDIQVLKIELKLAVYTSGE